MQSVNKKKLKMKNPLRSPLNDREEKLKFIDRNLPSVERSDGTVEEFKPERIIESLVKETGIDKNMAVELTGDVVIHLMTAGHKQVTAPYIREHLCTILDRKYRNKYTRLGDPYYDFEQRFGKYFTDFDDYRSIADEDIEEVIDKMDPEDLVYMVKRYAKDYIGVRNQIIKNGF